jgi:outer membrane protein assembly factor BamB
MNSFRWGIFILALLPLSCSKFKTALPGQPDRPTHDSSRVVWVGARPSANQRANDSFSPRPYDWPGWQGPHRDGTSVEKGLLRSWPKDGPPLLWKVYDLGTGYSSPSVAAGRIFGMSYDGNRELVWCLGEDTGKELWRIRIANANRNMSYAEGSRSTPSVDGELVYALGVSGDLVCLETATGKERWHKNLVTDFGGRMPAWGYCESPLVDGDKVIATPGGKDTLVALDKQSGATRWKANVPQGDLAAYSSAIVAMVDGEREYVQFLAGGVVGVAAEDGRFLWRYDHPANGSANCLTPIFHDECVFAASNYGVGGGLARLRRNGSSVNAEEVYFTNHMKNHHGGVVLAGGYLYGANDEILTCLDFKTGKVKWHEREPGKGSLIWADGLLFYRNEHGEMVLIRAKPDSYEQLGRFEQPEQSPAKTWAHPVLANGRLYLRDQDLLLCYDVKLPKA